ncbi:MAG: DUF4239 domain-containing protein [Crocinitomicaceae bacterium]|nr:DUF4239 domain-containing protein [Crocinitomicaceae bacterium]
MLFELIIGVNPFVLVGITSVFIIGIALLIHIKARRVVKGFITGDDSKLAAMLFSVNASILTLLFSITLFQVRSEFTHIRNSSGAEVSQINDVTRSILNLNVKNQKKLLPVFHDYLDFVLKNEFGFEIERETIRESNEKYDDFRTAVLKMQPANFIEKQFRTHLIYSIKWMKKEGLDCIEKKLIFLRSFICCFLFS